LLLQPNRAENIFQIHNLVFCSVFFFVSQLDLGNGFLFINQQHLDSRGNMQYFLAA